MSQGPRETLQALLGLRCVFPERASETCDEFTARCMLESPTPGKAVPYKDSMEDVIVRLKSLANETDEYSKSTRIKVRYLICIIYIA